MSGVIINKKYVDFKREGERPVGQVDPAVDSEPGVVNIEVAEPSLVQPIGAAVQRAVPQPAQQSAQPITLSVQQQPQPAQPVAAAVEPAGEAISEAVDAGLERERAIREAVGAKAVGQGEREVNRTPRRMFDVQFTNDKLAYVGIGALFLLSFLGK